MIVALRRATSLAARLAVSLAALVPALRVAVLATALVAVTGARADDTPSKAAQDPAELRWGADPAGGAPFAFFDPNDPSRVIGFEVDVMEELARRLRRTPVLERADWLALFDALEAKRCDVLLNGFEVTDERAAVARFSVPYFRYGQQIVVRAEDAGRVRSLADLAGKRVAVLNGSAAVDVLRDAGFPDSAILQYDDSLAPYVEVRLGRADAALADSIIAAYYAGGDPMLSRAGEPFAHGVYAAVTRKGDEAFAAHVDGALRAMQADGSLGEILQRWGLWDASQSAIGTAQGAPQEVKPEARGPVSADAGAGAESSAGPAEGASPARAIVAAVAKGALITVALTAIAMPLATITGLFLALGRISPRAWLRRAAVVYITVVRGTPLLVQIFLIYFSLPPLGQWLYGASPEALQSLLDLVGGASFLTFPPLFVGALCLAANYAAYEAEVHRAGIEAVPAIQWDAARALGLSRAQAIRHVIAPQGVRVAMPAIVNDLNSLIKDSCLVSVIGVTDLLAVCLGIGKARFSVPEMLVIAATVYLVLSIAGDLFGNWIEHRLRARGFGAASAHAKGAHA